MRNEEKRLYTAVPVSPTTRDRFRATSVREQAELGTRVPYSPLMDALLDLAARHEAEFRTILAERVEETRKTDTRRVAPEEREKFRREHGIVLRGRKGQKAHRT